MDHLTPSRVEAIRAFVQMDEIGFDVVGYSLPLRKALSSSGSSLPFERTRTRLEIFPREVAHNKVRGGEQFEGSIDEGDVRVIRRDGDAHESRLTIAI